MDLELHPEIIQKSVDELESRMIHLKISNVKELGTMRKQDNYSQILRNFKFAEKAYSLQYIDLKILRTIMEEAKINSQSEIIVKNHLNLDQWRTLIKPSSSEETGSILVFERYRVEYQLSQGGGGKIYLAKDINTDRSVIIKCLSLQNENDVTLVRQLERESKILATLHHPNIVNILEFGKDKNHWFLIMDYIRGENLENLLVQRKTRWSLPALLEKAVHLADALEYVHRQGIIHRDVKPANMIVDNFGTPFLTDFGLSKGGSFKTVTEEGYVSGTPYFMAPEQFSNNLIDHRVDGWAFGVSIYTMITGNNPYYGRDIREVAKKICTASYRPIAKLVKGFPVALDRLLAKCLAKDPDFRYPSMQDIIKDLNILLRQKIGYHILIPLADHRKRFWLF